MVKMKKLTHRLNIWYYVYKKYLENLYNITYKYKGKIFNNINYKEFVVFTFNHSSQYISPFAK